MHAGGRQEDVLTIADACLESLKAVACSAFADHGELLRAEGGDIPEDVWKVFHDTESDKNEVLTAACCAKDVDFQCFDLLIMAMFIHEYTVVDIAFVVVSLSCNNVV